MRCCLMRDGKHGRHGGAHVKKKNVQKQQHVQLGRLCAANAVDSNTQTPYNSPTKSQGFAMVNNDRRSVKVWTALRLRLSNLKLFDVERQVVLQEMACN